MDQKIQFGVDYFSISRLLSLKSSSTEYLQLLYQAACLFLTFWDFNRWEIEKVTSIWYEDYQNDYLLNEEAFNRLINHFKNQSKEIQLKFCKQLGALTYIDNDVTKGQKEFMKLLMTEFDLRPSEFVAAADQGGEIAIYLMVFSQTQAKQSLRTNREAYLNWLLYEDDQYY